MVNTTAEFNEAPERAVGLTFSNERLHCRPTNTLDRAQPIQDGFIVGNAEMIFRQIDIRRDQLEMQLSAIVFQRDEAIRVVQIRAHHGGHERRRIVRFQIRSLVGKYRVSCRVGFVKAVPGELLHQVENAGSRFLGDATFGCTRHENFALLCHLFGFLFAHCTSQQVSGTERVARQYLCNLHNLLLV